jgi:hypothetical protein
MARYSMLWHVMHVYFAKRYFDPEQWFGWMGGVSKLAKKKTRQLQVL